jgi:hypothetical protein
MQQAQYSHNRTSSLPTLSSIDGLDIVKVKELLREHVEEYDDWAPELDRVIRWVGVALGPVSAAQSYVEENITPLAEIPHYASKFENIPSASQLYDTILDKPVLPLDPVFSSLVSRVAPYLTFQQIQFFLEARVSSDWQPEDLRRIRYVFSIKRKALEIAESYGGLSFLPQSFLVSVFLGEATRSSLRASSKWHGKKKKRSHFSSVSSLRQNLHSAPSTTGASRLRRRRNFGGQSQKMSSFSTEGSIRSFGNSYAINTPENLTVEVDKRPEVEKDDGYELGDSLLGPQDVAILLQAGLTSVMKTSTVVQLNQRMLLDLMCSQPRSFAVAVLAEIGSEIGQGANPRGLTSVCTTAQLF